MAKQKTAAERHEAMVKVERNERGKRLNALGQEIIDPTPMAPPIGWKPQPSMIENIRNMVRSELLARAAEADGKETFEEADDFDIEDDPADPNSPWENEFDPPVREIMEAGRRAIAEKQAAAAAAAVGGAGGTPPADVPRKPRKVVDRPDPPDEP